MSDHRPGPGWGSGSDGQRATAAALTALPSTCHFFHGMPMGRSTSSVDHLVVGPTGVWVIDSVRWTGPVTATADGMLWRGSEPIHSEIERMLERAAYARRALDAEVRPVLCVIGGALPLPRHRIGGVDIVDVDWLVTLITSQPAVLDTAGIGTIVDAASQWRVQPPPHLPARLTAGVPPPPPPPGQAAAAAAASAGAGAGAGGTGRRGRRRSRPGRSAALAMAVATVVAICMIALIAYLLVHDDDTVVVQHVSAVVESP